MKRRPSLVAHADWGTILGKRWLARAVLDGAGRYVAKHPEPVGEAETLLRRLHAATKDGEPVFVGFDFPIGLPTAYAERAGIDDFLAALPRFGGREWVDFYHVATCSGEIALRRIAAGGTGRSVPEALVQLHPSMSSIGDGSRGTLSRQSNGPSRRKRCDTAR